MTGPAENAILTVGQLNGQIRDTLQSAFGSIWVAGEITDLSRPNSGHIYFSLKDSTGSLKAVAWRTTANRLSFEPEDGMQVLCSGSVDVYPPRGTYQLIVRQMQLQGEGALQAALRKLRDKLEAEGLFDPQNKRPLPSYPRRIAVVTSPSGAALRDYLEVIRRRWSAVEVVVVPTRVQGQDVGEEIEAAIRRAGKIPKLDAILVTRGGGSLEDLWGFNAEAVVRAIHEATVPVVSAIGHEIDVTLSDLVADVRALTPTEAGELMVPDGSEIARRLEVTKSHIHRLLTTRFSNARERLQQFENCRVLRDPFLAIRERERPIDEFSERLQKAMQQQLSNSKVQLANLAQRLESLSPLQVLARGYSLTQTEEGAVVRSVDQLATDESVNIRIQDGSIAAKIVEIEKHK